MGTEILKSFGVLQSELEQAKSSLKGVDENIKRLIGRDPSELIPRPGLKRNISNEENNRNRQRNVNLNRARNFNHENDEPVNKRRPSVFKRLSERPTQYEEEILQQPQKQLISKVIVTPKEVPSRQDALAAQSTDEKSKARNRRMFGALLGTLQKFQQEETKLKSKEQKRAQVEKKIEEHEIREKAEIKKERQELFFNRKQKQAEIKMIELKMTRMREYAAWEEQQKPRSNYILTKSKPHIYYLPRRINEPTKGLLEKSRGDVEKIIEKRKFDVSTELQHIEERTKKNFEQKKNKGARQDNKTAIQDEHEAETELKNVPMNEFNSCIDDGINENSDVSENCEIVNFETAKAVTVDKNATGELEVPKKMETDGDNTEVQNSESEEVIINETKSDDREDTDLGNDTSFKEHSNPKEESD